MKHFTINRVFFFNPTQDKGINKAYEKKLSSENPLISNSIENLN